MRVLRDDRDPVAPLHAERAQRRRRAAGSAPTSPRTSARRPRTRPPAGPARPASPGAAARSSSARWTRPDATPDPRRSGAALYAPDTIDSRPAQNGARSSRLSTLPAPDFGSGSCAQLDRLRHLVAGDRRAAVRDQLVRGHVRARHDDGVDRLAPALVRDRRTPRPRAPPGGGRGRPRPRSSTRSRRPSRSCPSRGRRGRRRPASSM